jgi:pilus assembly protein CpaB
VVVAKVEVPLGTVLTEEQLTTVDMPKEAAPEIVFGKPEEVLGRVAVTTIGPKEVITEYRLAPKGSLAGLAALVPNGYRAMAVRVDDETSVAGMVSPGMIVDVLAVINPPDNSNQGPISKVVLQNVKVLAAGSSLTQSKDQVDVNNVRTVTLLVTPEQAEALVLSSFDAKLRLIMRNYVDQGEYKTDGKIKRQLVQGMGALPIPESNAVDNPRGTAPPRRSAPRPIGMGLPPMIPMNTFEAAAKPKPAPTPAPPSHQVEVFEGVKKKNVDFP